MHKFVLIAISMAASTVQAGFTQPMPVSEPGMWMLLGVAGVALAISRFKNKK